MKLPLKKIKLGYNIIEVRNFVTSESPNLYGAFYPQIKEIALNLADMPSELKLLNTFIHELLHACWYEYHLDDRKSATEEEIVLALSDGLTQALVRNKALGKYLYDATN